jgi:hypothetical protein
MGWSQLRTFLKTSYGRNQINVLGTVNAINADTIMAVPVQLKGKYAKPIVLVLNNAKYQR